MTSSECAAARAGAAHSTPSQYFAGSHRIVDPEQTLKRVQTGMRDLGITRVADVTGLDFIGLPVVMVVRPASRTLSVHQGKGLTHQAARISGLMEAFESACAERIPEEIEWSAASRIHDSIDLLSLQLRSRTLDFDAPMPWVQASSLLDERTVRVPAECVHADFTWPPLEGLGWFHPTSNGLASGNSPDEARLHALCEVVERDCLALWSVRCRFLQARSIDLDTISHPDVLFVLAHLDRARMRVALWDITSDTDLPCFLSAIDDADTGRPPFLGLALGSGCHPSAAVAITRALTEAAQGRLTVIAGSRDDLTEASYAGIDWNGNVLAAIAQRPALPRQPFEDRSCGTPTLAGDLTEIVRRLDRAGIRQILAAALPSPIDGLFCERILVPELEPLNSTAHYRPGPRAQALHARLDAA